VTAAPVLALTSAGTVLLAAGALALLVYGDQTEAPVSAGGAVLLFAELEHVWGGDPARLELAAASAGTALLVAFELRAWARGLAEAPAVPGAIRAHAASLGSALAAIGVATALLALLARGEVHEALFGVAGAAAAVAVFGALLLQVRRLARAG
jgi:hypothetical protein